MPKLTELPLRENLLPFVNDVKQDETMLFKGNLPLNLTDLANGNGEGCWFQFLNPEDKEKYEANGDETIEAILLNDSVYWPPIEYGTVLKLKGRGDKRPVLDVDWVQEMLKDEIDFKQIMKERE